MPLIWVVPAGWHERNDIVLAQPNRSSQAQRERAKNVQDERRTQR